MTIEKITPGGGKPERYFIRNEAGTTLAWFDRLDVAACVLRYLKGAPMPTADAEQAHAAMQAFDSRKEGDND